MLSMEVKKAATIRCVGAHRRWDVEGLVAVRGVPRSWRPEAEVQRGDFRALAMKEEELQRGVRRCMKTREALRGAVPPRRVSDPRLRRLEDAIRSSLEGQIWASRQKEKEHRDG